MANLVQVRFKDAMQAGSECKCEQSVAISPVVTAVTEPAPSTPQVAGECSIFELDEFVDRYCPRLDSDDMRCQDCGAVLG